MTGLYRTIGNRRAGSPELHARTPIARLVYLHLIIGETAGQVPGIVRTGLGALADDTGFDLPTLRTALLELAEHTWTESRQPMLQWDEAARVIRLPGVAEECARIAANPKAVVGWVKVLAALPPCRLRAEHVACLRAVTPVASRHLFDAVQEGSALPIDSQSIPNRAVIGTEPNQETEPDTDPEQDQNNTTRAEPAHVPALALEPAPPARAPRTRRRAAAPSDPAAAAQAAQVFSAWQDLRVELGLADRATTMAACHAADIAKPADGAEVWLTVLRRAAESLRREAQDSGRPARECKGAQYFTLSTLSRASNRQRYLDQDFLDQPRTVQARASPPRSRGPAPPQNDDRPPPETERFS